jgi:hypothetical protein
MYRTGIPKPRCVGSVGRKREGGDLRRVVLRLRRSFSGQRQENGRRNACRPSPCVCAGRRALSRSQHQEKGWVRDGAARARQGERTAGRGDAAVRGPGRAHRAP